MCGRAGFLGPARDGATLTVLLQQAALLALEKQILPPPEDHVH